MSLVTTFLQREFHVILLNQRGVGNSSGGASFTGLTESKDLQKVVLLALKEIEAVEEVVLLVRFLVIVARPG